MTFADIIKTVLEFAAVVLLIVGFINEKKVVAFEERFIFATAASVSREKKLQCAQKSSREPLRIFMRKSLF